MSTGAKYLKEKLLVLGWYFANVVQHKQDGPRLGLENVRSKQENSSYRCGGGIVSSVTIVFSRAFEG